MKTKQTSALGIAKKAMPIALVYTIQQQTGVEAAQVDTQAHIQEIAGLVQAALAESGEATAIDSSITALSTNEINAQIHSTINEAIKSQQSEKTNSKLGFLQKVVSLECFFGGSDCLFKDKKSMMAGKVTEFAQKRFAEGNTDVSQYLAQVKQQVSQDLQANAAIKSIDRAQQSPVDHSNLDVAQDIQRVSEQESHLNKQLHDSVQGLLTLNQKKAEDDAPAKNILVKTPVAGHNGTLGPKEQLVKVPIDDYDSIGVVVSPTFPLDDIKSVSLKSFRKVVGYDTFDAIRKGSRSETKDVNEFYNVTVSMLVMREPAAPAAAVVADTFQGGKTLKQMLDKGFPYDDGDVDVSEKAAAGQLGRMSAKAIIGKLNGENVTRQSLKNLITDTTTPVTASLVQLDSQKSDADGLFKLMDANVTRGNLKNLVTDKPAPITVALAQKSDADGLFKLMDANVTRGNLKNLVTDKPAPITVALAQKSDADGLFKLMDANVTRGNLKNLVTDKPAPITVALAQTKNPVWNPPFNNWSVNQPSPPHEHGMRGNEDLGQREIIIDGVNYDFVQVDSQNPVVNPPFNNWSVNQPSVPHDTGLAGKADLGQNIIVDGHHVHFAQHTKPLTLAQIIPINERENQPGNLFIKERDANHAVVDLAQVSSSTEDEEEEEE